MIFSLRNESGSFLTEKKVKANPEGEEHSHMSGEAWQLCGRKAFGEGECCYMAACTWSGGRELGWNQPVKVLG